jgi:predicted nucleic acid-binding protein
MTLVIDASVAVKWFVAELLRTEARSLIHRFQDRHAPDFIIAEVGNVAWRKFSLGEINEVHARSMTILVEELIPTLHPVTGLHQRALDIALAVNHSFYDCLYVACAEHVDGVLVTADQSLVRKVERTDFAHCVTDLRAL